MLSGILTTNLKFFLLAFTDSPKQTILSQLALGYFLLSWGLSAIPESGPDRVRVGSESSLGPV